MSCDTSSALLALVLLTSCATAGKKADSASTPSAPLAQAHPGQSVEAVPPGAFVARATADSQQEAQAGARQLLLQHHFSGSMPPATVRELLLAHTREGPMLIVQNGVQVQLWVDAEGLKSAVHERLGQQAHGSEEPAYPLRSAAAVRKALATLQSAEERSAWCTLIADTGEASCAEDGVARAARVRAAIVEAGSVVKLRQLPPDGTPYRLGASPYRPLVVQAISATTQAAHEAWSDLPLRLYAAAGLFTTSAGATDASGQWRLAWQRVPRASEMITLQVDAEALLDKEHAALWPVEPVQMKMRPLTSKTLRVLVVVYNGAADQDPLLDLARAQTVEALAQRLPGAVLTASSVPPKPAVGDELAAAHDVVVQADVEWAFASALGGRSVWYEAKARLEVKNAWTDEVVLRSAPSVQQAGIGEKHAAKQAVHKLSQDLAGAIAAALQTAFP